MSTKNKNYALPIAIMFALFFMIAFVTGYQNPLGKTIEKMTGDNVIMTQLGTFANFLAYLIMGIPAGMMLGRIGYRKTALWAVTVGFLGVLITYLSGFIENDNTTAVAVYILGAFVAGFSMTMLNTVVNPMLNSLGKNQNQGNQLVQFGGTCNSLGATLAPAIVGGLIGGAASTISAANPVFYMAMAIFFAAFLVLYFTKLPEPKDLGKDNGVKVGGALKFRHFVFGMLAIFCYVGIEVGVANWTTQYLDKSEIVNQFNTRDSMTIAGSVCAVYWLFMLIGRFLGGAIGSKVSSRAMLTTTSLLAIVLLCCGIFLNESKMAFFGFDVRTLSFFNCTIPVNAICFVCVGLCTSVQWGAIFNLAVEGLGKYTQVASGLFMMMVCGGGILPFIQGTVAGDSIIGSFIIPVILSAYLLSYALIFSRPSKKLMDKPETLYENGKAVKA